jgi:hypothetical protein
MFGQKYDINNKRRKMAKNNYISKNTIIEDKQVRLQ